MLSTAGGRRLEQKPMTGQGVSSDGGRRRAAVVVAGPLPNNALKADGHAACVRKRRARGLRQRSADLMSATTTPGSVADSPIQDLFLDATLNSIPGFQFHRACVDRVDSATDLRLPGRLGVRISGAVQAGQNLGGEFGPFILAKAESVRENGFCCPRHAGNSTFSDAAEQPAGPFGLSCHWSCKTGGTTRARPGLGSARALNDRRNAMRTIALPKALSILVLSLCLVSAACTRGETRKAWDGREKLTREEIASLLRESPGEYIVGIQEVVDNSRCYGPTDGSSCPLTVRMVEFIGGEPGRSPERCEGWTYNTMEMRMEKAWPNRQIGRRRLVIAHPTNRPDLYGNRLFILDPTTDDVKKLREILRDVRGDA